MKYHFAILVWLLLQRFAISVHFEEFLGYPFGPENGDTLMPQKDDTVVNLRVTNPFPAFGIAYEYVSIDINGLVSFHNDNLTYSLFSPDELPLDGSDRWLTMVAPFWGDIDVDTLKGGNVYYRILDNSSSLEDFVIELYNEDNPLAHELLNLTATWALIVTWVDVGYYPNGTDLKNTFQILIATNYNTSVAVFNYAKDRIQWSKTETGNVLAGINAGDGEYSYTIDGSLTDSMEGIDKVMGNTGVEGQWFFMIQEKQAIEPNSNVVTPTSSLGLSLGVGLSAGIILFTVAVVGFAGCYIVLRRRQQRLNYNKDVSSLVDPEAWQAPLDTYSNADIEEDAKSVQQQWDEVRQSIALDDLVVQHQYTLDVVEDPIDMNQIDEEEVTETNFDSPKDDTAEGDIIITNEAAALLACQEEEEEDGYRANTSDNENVEVEGNSGEESDRSETYEEEKESHVEEDIPQEELKDEGNEDATMKENSDNLKEDAPEGDDISTQETAALLTNEEEHAEEIRDSSEDENMENEESSGEENNDEGDKENESKDEEHNEECPGNGDEDDVTKMEGVTMEKASNEEEKQLDSFMDELFATFKDLEDEIAIQF